MEDNWMIESLKNEFFFFLRERMGRQPQNLHLLVHFPDVHLSQDCIRSKPGMQSSGCVCMCVARGSVAGVTTPLRGGTGDWASCSVETQLQAGTHGVRVSQTVSKLLYPMTMHCLIWLLLFIKAKG